MCKTTTFTNYTVVVKNLKIVGTTVTKSSLTMLGVHYYIPYSKTRGRKSKLSTLMIYSMSIETVIYFLKCFFKVGLVLAYNKNRHLVSKIPDTFYCIQYFLFSSDCLHLTYYLIFCPTIDRNTYQYNKMK